MRLICPTCGTAYETPEGMVPAAGRHVQCSACHTRWFVRGAAGAPASEEQILTRLENWRPRPVAAPAHPPATGDASPRPRPVEPLRVVPTPARAPAAGEAPAAPKGGTVTPLQRELPTKPAERPSVARPAPVPEALLRPAPRLDLQAPRVDPEPAPPAPRSRFLHGFVLALALALLAFAAYRFEAEIAAAVPAAGPALDAYAATIDDQRAAIEELIDDLRGTSNGG